MKYTIHIDDQFWPAVHPDWSTLTSDEKLERKEKFVKDLEVFLNTGSTLDNLHLNDVQVKNYVQIIHQVDMWATEGVDRIQAERKEQYQKHGYDAAHDDTLVNDELVEAAIALLTEDPERWPANMDRAVFNNASEKDTVGRMAVAGAFVAAELDRLLRARAANGGVVPLVTVPPAGTVVRIKPGLYERLVRNGWDAAEANTYRGLTDKEFTTLGGRVSERSGQVWVGIGPGLEVPLNHCVIVPPAPAPVPAPAN